jgi:hypothetical protein
MNGPASFLKRLFMDPACINQKYHAEFVRLSLDESSTMEEARMLQNELKTKKEEQKVLSTFGKTIKYNMAVCIRKTKLRKWIASHRLGMLLLIRFRGFRIHKCKNEHCRWCDYNRKRINGGM